MDAGGAEGAAAEDAVEAGADAGLSAAEDSDDDEEVPRALLLSPRSSQLASG